MSKHSQHSLFAPSAAARWMACPGSVRLCREVPERPATPEMAEGTRAHEIAAALLASKTADPRRYAGKSIAGHTLTAEMAGHLAVYVKHCRKIGRGSAFKGEELAVSYGPDGRVFGTADFVAYCPSGTLHVADLKYGAGVPVLAHGNPQLAIYGLAAADTFLRGEADYLVLHIVQPRHREVPPVQTWVMAASEQAVWRDKIGKAVTAASRPDAPLVTGAQCRWCPAAAICPAFRESAAAAFEAAGSPVTGAEERPADFARLVELAQEAEKWAKTVQAHALGWLNAGGELPGWSLEDVRPSRVWQDPSSVPDELSRAFNRPREDFLEPESPISPAQAEKLLGRSKRAASVLGELISLASSGRKKLVRTARQELSAGHDARAGQLAGLLPDEPSATV